MNPVADLAQNFNSVTEGLSRQRNANEVEASRLLSLKEELDQYKKQLDEANQKLKEDQLNLSHIKDIDAANKMNTEERTRLEELRVELKLKEIALKKHENKLFQIKQDQDDREKKINQELDQLRREKQNAQA